MEENKIDKILSSVLTMSGDITIIKGQLKQTNQRLDKLEQDHQETKQQLKGINQRLEIMEQDHKEFKEDIKILLNQELTNQNKRISKQAKAIKKLQNKPSLISCIRTGIRKLASK